MSTGSLISVFSSGLSVKFFLVTHYTNLRKEETGDSQDVVSKDFEFGVR